MNWSGWRWMLFLEGVPAVVFGFVCYFRLVDKPEQAKWLTVEEKVWLTNELEKNRQQRKDVQHLSVFEALKNGKILYLSFIYFVYQCGSLGVGYWMPQIIKGLSASSISNFEVGLIATVPYIVATLAMILWSRSSDNHDERKLHSAIPLAVAALALYAVGFVTDVVGAVTLISIALSGLYAFKSPFWALPTLFLSRETASISIAIINSIGNLGGFFGPYMIGVLKSSNNKNPTLALTFLSALLVVSFLMTIFIKIGNQVKQERADS
jgi:ACS family tartrate transporter-like MFS transporter